MSACPFLLAGLPAVNFALNKPTWQGLTVNGLGAGKAVDGVTAAELGQCTWSGVPPRVPGVNGGAWMVVDLGSKQSISHVVIWGNDGECYLREMLPTSSVYHPYLFMFLGGILALHGSDAALYGSGYRTCT